MNSNARKRQCTDECPLDPTTAPARFQLRLLRSSEVTGTGFLLERARTFKLGYEPRALALRGDGRCVAVGTKDGTLYIAWLSPDSEMGCDWSSPRTVSDEVLQGAVRGLAFCGDRLLAASRNRFAILKVLGTPGCVDRPIVVPTAAPPDPLLDITRLISLVRPDSERFHGPIAVAATRSSRLLLLRRGDGRVHSRHPYRSELLQPEELFADWPTGLRLVDGVWTGNKLWVLDARGTVRAYRRRGDAFESVAKSVTRITCRRGSGEFRGLAACDIGLAVQTSEDVVFLELRAGDQLHKAGEIDAPNGTAMTIARYGPAKAREYWTVLGDHERGLVWDRWNKDRRHPDEADDLHESRSPIRSLGRIRVGCSRSRVLFLAFASGAPGQGTLACGTQDHELRLYAFRPSKGPNRPADERQAELLKHVDSSFDDGGRLALEGRLHDALTVCGEHRLVDVVEVALDAWQKRRRTFAAPEQLTSCLLFWLLLVLRRAHEINENVVRIIAGRTCKLIAALRDDPETGKREDPALQSLMRIGGLLRKWIQFGYTYGDKATGWLDLTLHNYARGNHLDALAYLTRLIGERCDTLWSMAPPPGPVVPTPDGSLTEWPAPVGVWGSAVSTDGTFSVHSYVDGRILAVSEHGQPLRFAAPTTALERAPSLRCTDGHLHRVDTEHFLERYRHGSYARTLLLRDAPGGLRILCFALRGWRYQEAAGGRRQEPTLFAVLLRPQRDALEILSAHELMLDSEAYGLAALPGPEPGSLELLCGTHGDPHADTVCPFRPFRVRVSNQDRWQVDVEEAASRILPSTHARLSAHSCNPCWSLVAHRTAGKSFVWAGFDDGTVRAFRRQREDGDWREQLAHL